MLPHYNRYLEHPGVGRHILSFEFVNSITYQRYELLKYPSSNELMGMVQIKLLYSFQGSFAIGMILSVYLAYHHRNLGNIPRSKT